MSIKDFFKNHHTHGVNAGWDTEDDLCTRSYKIETAKSLLNCDLPIEYVSSATGLPINDVMNLENLTQHKKNI